MDDRYISLEDIDTSVAAKNVAELLEDNKTYFLNGSWGSGKTKFLAEVDKNTNQKLVTLDFWRLNDNRSTIEVVFFKIAPVYIYFSKGLHSFMCCDFYINDECC